MLGVQVMWLLDEFTMENGATRYMPGSHHRKHFPTAHEVAGRNEAEDQYFVASSGSVVFMHAAMWHTVRRNSSGTSRSCLLSTYVPAWVVKKE